MKNIAFFVSLLLIILLSNFIFVHSYSLFGVNSSSQRDGMIVGLFFYAFIIFIFARNVFKINKKYIVKIIKMAMVVSIQYLAVLMTTEGDLDNLRFWASFLLLILMAGLSVTLVNYFYEVEERVIDKSIKCLYLILLFDGLLSSFLYMKGYQTERIFIFFFEPSHFSLIYLPILCYIFLRSNFKQQFFHILIAFSIALLIRSTTLLTGIILMLSLFFFSSKGKTLILIMMISSILLSMDNDIKKYFLDRIILTSENDNISVLSFLSGWEAAYLSFVNTYGLGIGFQQLGHIAIFGTARAKLTALGLDTLNIYDASSLAPKIIAEFGLIGIIILIGYMRYFFVVINKIRYIHRSVDIFFVINFLFFAISLFVRGVGYFSISTFMFLASVYWISRKGSKI